MERAEGLLGADRKSTRLNSSHTWISYAVFCLKKRLCVVCVVCMVMCCVVWSMWLCVGCVVRRGVCGVYGYVWLCFFLMILRPPRSTLFPCTTLFRSKLSYLEDNYHIWQHWEGGRPMTVLSTVRARARRWNVREIPFPKLVRA